MPASGAAFGILLHSVKARPDRAERGDLQAQGQDFLGAKCAQREGKGWHGLLACVLVQGPLKSCSACIAARPSWLAPGKVERIATGWNRLDFQFWLCKSRSSPCTSKVSCKHH